MFLKYDDKMENLEREFLEFLKGVYKSFGLDTLSSNLYAILFIEPNEISIEELSKKTGYSLASISNKMRILESIGIAKRIKKPGTKKVYYIVEKDIIKIQMKKMEMFSDKLMTPAKESLPKIIKDYKEKTLTDKDKQKLEIIENFYSQMQKIQKGIEHMKQYFDKI